jgi:polysaccharide biosynthesis/export protein
MKTKLHSPVTAVLLALSLAILAGCQQPAPQAFSDTPSVTPPAPYTANRISEGDAIKVAFEGDTNMNTVVKVQLDGTITLSLVGAVKAAGLTPELLRADLMQRYKSLLSVNEITVSVVAASASVYVSGAVLKPGRIPLDRPLTALEAIMEAGGFIPNKAKSWAVSITRIENGKQQHFELDLKRALKGEDSTPFYLRPSDMIFVPEKTFNF